VRAAANGVLQIWYPPSQQVNTLKELSIDTTLVLQELQESVAKGQLDTSDVITASNGREIDSYNNDEGANEDKESHRNDNALNYIGMLQLKGDYGL
jgi:PDZ domain-containing secreted protein